MITMTEDLFSVSTNCNLERKKRILEVCLSVSLVDISR